MYCSIPSFKKYYIDLIVDTYYFHCKKKDMYKNEFLIKSNTPGYCSCSEISLFWGSSLKA